MNRGPPDLSERDRKVNKYVLSMFYVPVLSVQYLF